MIDCILRGILEHAICLACCQEDALYEANNVFSLCHQQQQQAKDEHFCFNTESSCAGPEVSTQAPVRKNHDIKNTEERYWSKVPATNFGQVVKWKTSQTMHKTSVFSHWSRGKTREVCGLQVLFTTNKTVLEVVLLNSGLVSDSTRWQLSKALEGKEAACVKTTLLIWSSWLRHDKANVGDARFRRTKQAASLETKPMQLLASWSLANSFLSPQELSFAVHSGNS